MEKVVVLFTKPFGAYAKGDRAGFDADAAKHLKELGVAKSDVEPAADQVEQELDGFQPAQVGAAEEKLQGLAPEQPPAEDAQQAPQASESQSKPSGKAPKSAKA
ncbi:hypothetical protein N5D77_07660 [Comamonas thiooxydans]|uniref:Uncharacterized protein n=1 Tax=Comamonas thiooxydans TaxID=363952 RepID=A0AA42PYR8_9BURK|nr:hypothetical protein [Comamonas thiooxydans]MDH1334102.1 hypothetical protein [Comamonas thiooxydans]MDH1739976.1 hypothetical protein [Comamonas thiooxydans]MDH1786444.1 hypothetical protein [Comamonas thiooxydans]